MRNPKTFSVIVIRLIWRGSTRNYHIYVKNKKWRSRREGGEGGGGGLYFALESNYIKSMLYKNSDGFNEF